MKVHQLKIMALAVAIFTLTAHYCYGGERAELWKEFAKNGYSTGGDAKFIWTGYWLDGPYTVKDASVPGWYGGISINKKSKADFSNCTLNRGKIKSNCTGANFSGADLHGVEFVTFEQPNEYGKIEDTLYCQNVDFTNAKFFPDETEMDNDGKVVPKLTEAINIRFEGSSFDNANLNGGKFSGSLFYEGTNMIGTDCSPAIEIEKGEDDEEVIIRTNFDGATFKDMTIINGNFRLAELMNVTMDNVEIYSYGSKQTDFSEADFSGAKKIKLPEVWHVTFKETKFNGANIEYTNIFESRFTDADFTGAKLLKTNLDSTFTRPIFAGTIMSEVDFEGSDLNKPNFTGAVLDDVNFYGAEVHDPDFTGATIVNTLTWTDGKPYPNEEHDVPPEWEV